MPASRPRSRAAKAGARAPTRRTRLDVEERRTRLLELGLELFAHRPYDEISIDELAAAAGISKGLLYHYFSSKHEFYVACVRVAAAQLLERTEPKTSLDPVDRLTHGLDAYLDFVQERGRAYVTLFRGGVGADHDVARIVDETRDTIVRRLVAHLGGEQHPRTRNALRAWVGLTEAAILDWVEHNDLEREQIVELLVTAMAAVIQTTGLQPK